MAQKQQAIIYIENENKTEAEFMSRSFVKKEIKNRAYINALGAELASKYLASEGIDTTETHNLHSISKILEKIDVADIMLPNIHIDVRVVFDENQIFIPKSHAKLGIEPDIYLAMKLSPDFKFVEFLGYFEPARINKNKQNSDYYFIEKEKLSSPEKLTQYIKNFTGNTDKGISEEDTLHARELFISMADHNISQEEEQELISLLMLSDSLRDSILEFDNFETLSYSVGSSFASKLEELPEGEPVLTIEDNTENNEPQENEESTEENEEETTEDAEEPLGEEISTEEDSIEENVEDEVATDLDFSSTDEDIILDESFFSDDTTDDEEDLMNSTTNVDQPEEEPTPIVTEETHVEEDILPVQDNVEENLDMDVDIDLDMDSSIDLDNIDEDTPTENETPKEEAKTEQPKDEDPLSKIVGDALKKTIETATTAATAAAAISGAAEANVAGTASTEAMKLAGVAGDIVDDVVKKNLESQHTNLDKIDYAKTTTNANDVPEHIAAYDLSNAKIEADLEAEKAGQADTPTDLTELKAVDANSKGYENIEQEAVDFGNIEGGPVEEFRPETTENLEDLSHISAINSPTTPVEDLDIKLTEEKINEANNLSDLNFDNSTIDINADGTSSIDNLNFDLGLENNSDENLVDIGMTNELVIDNNNKSEEPISFDDFNQDLTEDSTIEDLSDAMLDETTFDTTTTEDVQTSTQEETQVVEELTTEEDITTKEDFDTLPSLEEDDILLDEDTTSNIESFEAHTTLEDDILDSDFITEEETTEPSKNEENTDTDNEESVDDFLAELSGDEDNTTSLESDMDTLSIEDTQTPEETDADFAELDELDDLDLTTTEESQTVEENIQPEQNSDEELNLDDLTEIEDTPIETTNAENTTTEEDFITEPEQTEKAFAVRENSIAISDKTFRVGEIPIDINNPEVQNFEGPEQLESLYNEDNVPGAALLQTPGRLGSARGNNSSKVGLGIGLGIAGIIIVLAMVGVIGFTVSKMLKPSEETPQPITDDATPTSPDNGVTDANTLNIDQNNVVNMDETTNTPQTQQPLTPTKKQQAKSTAPATVVPKNVQSKKIGATSFIEVKKLSWEVPDYISYNGNFRQYFQSAGKSLKLALTSDLLLATDFTYTDQVRVSVTFNQDGSFKESRMLLSSGSKQVDDIVLRTVNQTLGVLKAPHSVGNDESTTVILKIYF